MSPIDDELRALLSSRASGVDPAPDPLGGIESRAKGIRRRRVLTSVSGAAAVVVAVAVAVPLLVSGGGTTAVQQPGDGTPTPSATTSDAAFDPANPWEERGDTSVVPAAGCACHILFARHRSSGSDAFTFIEPDQLEYTRSAAAQDVLFSPQRTTLPADRRVLTWALSGDDGRGELVVIAAPDALVEYSSEGDGGWQQISAVGQAPKGIGIVPIEPEAPNDQIRVTEADGTVVEQAAPDWTRADTSTPVNVLTTWVHRGSRQVISTQDVIDKYKQAIGSSGTGHYRSLYDGRYEANSFTLGQAWVDGEPARLVSLTGDSTFSLGPVTPRDPWVVASVFAGPSSGKDLLVLLPRPGAGRVGYSPDASTPFTDVASGRSQEMEVGLVERDPKAQTDRVQVHRGDDSVILTAGVASFTCGAKECG